VATGVDAHEAVEHRLDLVPVRDLDEEAGRQLARPREQGAVDVDLLPHLLVLDDALRAAHLVDLEQQGLRVGAGRRAIEGPGPVE